MHLPVAFSMEVGENQLAESRSNQVSLGKRKQEGMVPLDNTCDLAKSLTYMTFNAPFQFNGQE